MSVLLIFGEAVIHLITLLVIIFGVYGNAKIYFLKHEEFIQKRTKLILFGLNITLIILIVALQLGFVGRMHWPDSTYHIYADVLNTTCFWCFLYFSTLRSWMYYYIQNWIFYTLELDWQHILNSNIDYKSANWFIRNNKRFGNMYYMQRLFGIYCIIGWVIGSVGIILSQINLTKDPLINMLVFTPMASTLFSCLLIFHVTIVCKTKKTNVSDDTFFIYWEQQRHSKLLAVAFVQVLIMIVVGNVVSIVVSQIIIYPFLFITLYAIVFTSTFSIYSRNYENIHLQMLAMQINDDMSTLDTEYNEKENNGENKKKKEKKIGLKQLLSTNKGIHRFAAHITKEISVECLLSYIEFSQFEEFCINKFISAQELEQLKRFDFICFPNNIPISGIIESNSVNKEEIFASDLRIMAHLIYEKYVRVGAEFEININSDDRKKLREALGDLEICLSENSVTITEIVMLFEKARMEMYRFLLFSFRRFKQDNDWEAVELSLRL
eukprot:484527_1